MDIEEGGLRSWTRSPKGRNLGKKLKRESEAFANQDQTTHRNFKLVRKYCLFNISQLIKANKRQMSASLPPRPALDSPPRPLSPSRRFPDDRERRPNRSMASQRFPPRRDDRDYPPPRRDERDFRRGDGDRSYSGPPRPRPPVDSYIAPADTYVPRGDGFRRRDDRPRDRYPGPRDPSRERRDGYGGRGRDFRDREPPGRQIYIPERRRGSSRPPYREPPDYPPRRDFRPGSPRRGGACYFVSSMSMKSNDQTILLDSYISRSSRSPRRRPLSPRPRSRPRTPPRPLSPPRQVKLGDHSISTSPPPKSPYNRGHSPRETQWNRPDHYHDRSRSPPSRRLSRERESITSDKDLRRDHDPETEKQPNETRVSSLPSPRSAPLATPHETESSKLHSPSRSHSRAHSRPSTPIKAEVQQDIYIPVESDAMKIDESSQDQGIPKEEPIETVEAEGDIKMKDRSPSPPRHPRADRFPHSRSVHDRSPPRGPRNPNLNQRGGGHGNNPNFSQMNTNSSSAFNYQQTPRRPRGYPNHTPSAPTPVVQTPPPPQPPIETKRSPTPEPDLTDLLPVIPVHQFPTLYTPDEDNEVYSILLAYLKPN